MMACTHPVLYKINDELKCIVCGTVIAPDSDETAKVDNPAQEEETAPEQPKNAVKRNRKRGVKNG